MVGDGFWMAAQSPPHIPIGIQPSLSLLIPLSSPITSVWPIPRRVPVNPPLRSRDLYAPNRQRTKGTRTPSTLLPLLNRTRRSSPAHRPCIARSCPSSKFYGRIAGVVGADPDTRTRCNRMRDKRVPTSTIGGVRAVLRKIHCRPEAIVQSRECYRHVLP